MLVIAGVCDDHLARDIAVELAADPTHDADWGGAGGTVLTVGDDPAWAHDNWDWAFRKCPAGTTPAHVLVISDDGVTTMFDRDEAGNDGREVANQALTSARGGGSMILNLWGPVEDDEELSRAVADGWSISVVRDWSELIDFARRFSADHHGGPSTDPSITTHRTEGANGRTG